MGLRSVSEYLQGVRELRNGLLKDGVALVGRDLPEGIEHEVPLVHLHMGDDQIPCLL